MVQSNYRERLLGGEINRKNAYNNKIVLTDRIQCAFPNLAKPREFVLPTMIGGAMMFFCGYGTDEINYALPWMADPMLKVQSRHGAIAHEILAEYPTLQQSPQWHGLVWQDKMGEYVFLAEALCGREPEFVSSAASLTAPGAVLSDHTLYVFERYPGAASTIMIAHGNVTQVLGEPELL